MAEAPATSTRAAAHADRAPFGVVVREYVGEIGIPRLLIFLFLVALLGTAVATKMDLDSLLSDSLVRVGRNGLLVLALLPAVQGGVGLNFGLPLGIVCGLVGAVVALNAVIT